MAEQYTNQWHFGLYKQIFDMEMFLVVASLLECSFACYEIDVGCLWILV